MSSLHEVAAYSAIDSDVGPQTGSDLAIDSRASSVVPLTRVPATPGDSSLRGKNYVAFQIEKGLDSRHRLAGGHITAYAT